VKSFLKLPIGQLITVGEAVTSQEFVILFDGKWQETQKDGLERRKSPAIIAGRFN
jgi:hypothetical protein